jgi:glycosyltransferase involved in cell wall biosynthesis
MISVIIPAHIPTQKHHSFLLRSLRSLENQTYKKFEVICVLNGCYVDYKEIIDTIKTSLDIKFITLEGKTSGAIARNTGIRESKYDFIAQLDADDQYHSEKLEKQIHFFNDNPEYDYVGTLATDYYPDGTNKDSCYFPGQYQTHESISNVIFHENVMCHGSIMFRKNSFNKMAGYNENNKPGTFWASEGRVMWEDWDLWIRSIKHGMKFYNMPERLYYWSVGTGVER